MKRKVRFLFLIALLSIFSSCGRERVDPIAADQCELDIETGLVSGVAPTASLRELKAKFPFFTGSVEENGNSDVVCESHGGGLFFLNRNLFFYTASDRVELRHPCLIQVSDDAFTRDLDYFIARFGAPVESWDSGMESMSYRFTAPYGILEVIFDSKGLVWRIAAIHTSDRVEQGDNSIPKHASS